MTSQNPIDPDGTLNALKVTLNAVAPPAPPRTILQLVPFQILPNNNGATIFSYRSFIPENLQPS